MCVVKEFAKAMIEIVGYNIRLFDKIIKTNKELALLAFNRNGSVLEYVIYRWKMTNHL